MLAKKIVLIIYVLIIALVGTIAQIGECPQSSKYQYYAYCKNNITFLVLDTQKVFNHLGESVKTYKSPESNFIDLTQEPPGLYLIRFLSSGGRSIVKRALIY